MAYFNDDIELIDVLRTAVIDGDLTDPNTNRLLKHVDPDRHQHIARRQNSDGSRRNTINHLRSTIYSSYVKDLYEEATEYFRTILTKASLNGFNSGRVVGEHSFKMDASKVLSLGTWDKVCEEVTASVFQSLEAERSTLTLLQKVATKLALNVEQNLIQSALPYLELRHALVHTDGRLSQEYVAQHPHIPRKANGSVNLTYTLITNARRHICALISAYDDEVVRTNLLAADDYMP